MKQQECKFSCKFSPAAFTMRKNTSFNLHVCNLFPLNNDLFLICTKLYHIKHEICTYFSFYKMHMFQNLYDWSYISLRYTNFQCLLYRLTCICKFKK